MSNLRNNIGEEIRKIFIEHNKKKDKKIKSGLLNETVDIVMKEVDKRSLADSFNDIKDKFNIDNKLTELNKETFTSQRNRLVDLILTTRFDRGPRAKIDSGIQTFIKEEINKINTATPNKVKDGITAERGVRQVLTQFVRDNFNINQRISMFNEDNKERKKLDLGIYDEITNTFGEVILKDVNDNIIQATTDNDLLINDNGFTYYSSLRPIKDRSYEDTGLILGGNELLFDIKWSGVSSGESLGSGNMLSYDVALKQAHRPLFYLILKHKKSSNIVDEVKIINIREIDFSNMKVEKTSQYLLSQVRLVDINNISAGTNIDVLIGFHQNILDTKTASQLEEYGKSGKSIIFQEIQDFSLGSNKNFIELMEIKGNKTDLEITQLLNLHINIVGTQTLAELRGMAKNYKTAMAPRIKLTTQIRKKILPILTHNVNFVNSSLDLIPTDKHRLNLLTSFNKFSLNPIRQISNNLTEFVKETNKLSNQVFLPNQNIFPPTDFTL